MKNYLLALVFALGLTSLFSQSYTYKGGEIEGSTVTLAFEYVCGDVKITETFNIIVDLENDYKVVSMPTGVTIDEDHNLIYTAINLCNDAEASVAWGVGLSDDDGFPIGLEAYFHSCSSPPGECSCCGFIKDGGGEILGCKCITSGECNGGLYFCGHTITNQLIEPTD